MSKSLDKGPILWTLAVVVVMVMVWQGFEFVGAQRYHNTALWQRWHPVMLTSPPQTATPVEVIDTRRMAQVAVQTDRGVYFLTGARYVPKAGEPVVVQANDRWELYLCAADGERCMTIHSFCAGAVWPNLQRDAEGRVAGCHAPHLANGTNAAVAAIVAPPPDRAGGPGGREKRLPPAQGIAHPREWAAEMGLPVPAP